MYRNGLYIKGKYVDVEDDQLFLFTYSNTSVESPEAIKNNYSKTITLNGTPNNNKLFDELYLVDSVINRFDTSKREPFELYDNGNLIESGYVKLNAIKYEKNNPSYDVTLYGMLGDFFYKLAYKDDSNDVELSLKDLKYDYKRMPELLGQGLDAPTQDVDSLSEDVDETKTLFYWNADFIWNSWLMQFTDKYPHQNECWEDFVTAAPVYSGYNEDFDNDVVVTNMNYPPKYADIMPKTMNNGTDTYSTKQNYAKIKADREMDQWEIRDLRSSAQRPAIKLDKLFKKIVDYSKQNGYDIVFDKDIDFTGEKDNALNNYFHKSYILLDIFDTSSEQTKLYSLTSPDAQTTSTSGWTENDIKFNDNLSIDTSKYNVTYFNLLLNERFRPLDNNDAQSKINNSSNFLTTSAYTFDGEYLRDKYTSLFGAFVYYFKIYDGDNLVNEKVFFVECCKRKPKFRKHQQIVFDNSIRRWIVDKIGHEVDYKIINENMINAITPAESDKHFITFENDISLNLALPRSSNVKVKLLRNYIALERMPEYMWTHWYERPNKMIYKFTGDSVENYSTGEWPSSVTNFTSQSIISTDSSVYYGSQEFKSQYISKADLFANTASPFKYLVDWCKLFNMRFRTDITTKTIYIEQHNNYFVDKIVNLTNKIDYSKDFNINPIYVDKRIYKFGIEADNESYAGYIYKKKYGSNYSSKMFNTKYEFDNETKQVFEDNIYKTNIDYLMSSPYFNTTLVKDNIQYPNMLLMPKYEYTLWNNEEEYSQTMFGLQSYYNILPKDDAFYKQCLFDKENKTLESMHSLVMFDKLYKMPLQNGDYKPYMLTDDLPILLTLNNDNNCYLNAYYDDAKHYDGDNYWKLRTQNGITDEYGTTGKIGIWTFMLPIMNNNLSEMNNYSQSYYFKEPNPKFEQNDFDSNACIFERYWSDYINDVFDKNTKVIECYAFLDEMPVDALRKFYLINNSLWTIQEITDYNYKSKEPTKLTLIRVKNKYNYINNGR